MQLSKPRVILSALAGPFYAWIRAMSIKWFGYTFDPATDAFVAALISAFGLVPKSGDAPRDPA